VCNDRSRLTRDRPIRAIVVGDAIFDRRPQAAPQGQKPSAVPRNEPRGERAFLFSGDAPSRRLPLTKQEAEVIGQFYASKPLLGERASEAALRQQIGSADVIHLATHGYLDRTRAMSSGVLLTVPETEPAIGETANDGFLQAWEIQSELKLRAELVVLSACETGRGEVVRAEGIVGLTRALQCAGARSIVASQWPVLDRSTTRLMVAFHRNLRAGLAKDEALRQAQVALMRDKSYAHPYYWAPFLLVGDPENGGLDGRGK
jgi:CHAT domain-containing protein